MTHRERILSACRRKQPDRLPWSLTMTEPIRKLLEEKTGHTGPIADYYDFDYRTVTPSPPVQATDFSSYYRGRSFDGPVEFDPEWGIALVEKDPGSIFRHRESPFDNKEFTVDDANTYPTPDWEAEYRYADVQTANDDWHAKGYATMLIFSFGTFDFSWQIRGYEQLLMDMALEEPAAQVLMDRVSDTLAAGVRNMAARGTDIVGFGEDVGTQQALIMSPAVWRAQIKPRFRKIVDAAKNANPEVLFFYHSDGNIQDIIPDLIEIGVDILNPVQPECMDPARIKETYGDRLAFWGAVGTQTVMPHGKPGEVHACVHQLCETVGKGGGFVCAPSHILEPDVPWENIEAFVSAVKECSY